MMSTSGVLLLQCLQTLLENKKNQKMSQQMSNLIHYTHTIVKLGMLNAAPPNKPLNLSTRSLGDCV